MVDALQVCVQNLDVEEVTLTNSVSTSCDQEQTFKNAVHNSLV